MAQILRESFATINQYLLIKLPDSAIWPDEFASQNTLNIEEKMKDITKKSIFLERTFLYVIRLILNRIHDKYAFKDEDKKYDFFDVNLALDDIKDIDGEVKREGGFYYIY